MTFCRKNLGLALVKVTRLVIPFFVCAPAVRNKPAAPTAKQQNIKV